MICYNVIPYNEEVLYSLLARQFEHTLGTNVSHGFIKIFGNKEYTATIDLPNHLDALFDNYLYRFDNSVDSIIRKYTLYPFYEPFLKMDKRSRILELIRGSYGSHIHNIAGINSSRLERSRYPRFCPQCILDLRMQGEESFWQRIHQVPGLIVCPIHNVFIQEYQPSFDQLNYSRFIAAERLSIRANCVVKNSNNTLFMISKTLENIFTRRSEFDVNTIDYREKLKGTRYMRGSLVNYSAITEDLVKCFGMESLRIYFPSLKFPLQWVPSVVRNPSACFNPIKHLLLDSFVHGISYNRQLFPDPMLKGPWKCLNPACGNYQNSIMQEAQVFFDKTLKRNAALIACNCAMIYKASSVERTGIRRLKISIKDYGALWRDTVLSLKNEGRSVNFIANKMQISRTVISNFLFPKSNKGLKDLKFQSELVKSRKEWKELLESFHERKISFAREKNSRLYKWLYNNDLAWLQVTNRLYGDAPRSLKLRLDWEKIDDDLVSRISETVEALRRSNFKGRITKCLISKIIRIEKNYIRINSSKIPNSIELLERTTEPTDVFQLRRLKSSICELQEKNQSLTLSKVIRNSGLKKVDDPKVINLVIEELRLKECL